VANYTVAGHAWISHRVGYQWRARSIGIFEISWALAMLVGAPIVAVLINRFGWRGPFVALAAGSLVAAFVVALVLPSSPPRDPATLTVDELHPDGALSDLRRRPAMTGRAWLVVGGSALLTLAGISVFVVSGSWLSDSFDVSTSGIGVVAMGFGAAELTASTSIAAFADRLGKLRSTLAGICTLLVGVGIMAIAGDRLAVGVAGLLVFLLGFEYGFVT
jgi:predicted MFS family arabinose efflux permease